MADELISKQAAIFKLEERFDFHRERSQRNIGSGFVEVHKEWAAMAMGVADCLDVVRKMPAASLHPKGEWDATGRYEFADGSLAIRCNQCGAALHKEEWEKYVWNFCPNCGANMRGEDT